MSTTDALRTTLLELIEVFEPTSPPTFIGEDGTTVTVPPEVEDIIDRAARLVEDEEGGDDDECPF